MQIKTDRVQNANNLLDINHLQNEKKAEKKKTNSEKSDYNVALSEKAKNPPTTKSSNEVLPLG